MFKLLIKKKTTGITDFIMSATHSSGYNINLSVNYILYKEFFLLILVLSLIKFKKISI